MRSCRQRGGFQMNDRRDWALERLEREIGELAAHIHAATCRWLEMVAESTAARAGPKGRQVVRAVAGSPVLAGAVGRTSARAGGEEAGRAAVDPCGVRAR